MNRAATSLYLLAALLLVTTGWTRNESVPKSEVEAAIVEPQERQPPATNEIKEGQAVEPLPLEGSGKTVWAKGFEGQLIAGLDGELYEPYRPSVIEFTQRSLRDRGLYLGPINGVLDIPTMQAIYAFQKASRILQLCGVPTPLTRTLLAQGSHTDPVPRT